MSSITANGAAPVTGESPPGTPGGSDCERILFSNLADNALVALTLMIAESNPDEKDIIAQVVVSLINGYN